MAGSGSEQQSANDADGETRKRSGDQIVGDDPGAARQLLDRADRRWFDDIEDAEQHETESRDDGETERVRRRCDERRDQQAQPLPGNLVDHDGARITASPTAGLYSGAPQRDRNDNSDGNREEEGRSRVLRQERVDHPPCERGR